MRRAALAVLVLFAVAPAAEAQRIVPLRGPPAHLGAWSPAAGGLVADGSAGDADASLVFDNQTSTGSVLWAGAGLIVMDWGLLQSAPENEVFAATFGYGTTTVGSVDLTLRLHAGATGSGVSGLVLELPLTDLPGSSDGSLAAYTFETFFDSAILPDGPLGWSYQAFDATTGPLLATGDAEPGIVDLLDVYAPDLSYLASTDGGAPFASLLLGLVGSFPGVLLWDTLPAGTLWLHGAGPMGEDTANLLEASGLPASSTAWFVLGAVRIDAPFKGGVMVPLPQLTLAVRTGVTGGLQVPLLVTDPLPSGFDLFAQCWVLDPGSATGWSGTNGVAVTTP